MSDLEAVELMRSAKEGLWGQAVSLITAYGSSLLNARLPAWMARPWTVSLLKMRYQTGTLVTPTGTDTGDPDAQTVRDLKVRLQWGVGGALETALMDYPFGGGTFQVHAASLNVYIDALDATGSSFGGAPLNPSRPPIIGGFLSPHPMNIESDWGAPTFSVRFGLASAGGQACISVPARARAYRIVPIDANATSIPMVVTQNAGSAASAPTGRDFSAAFAGENFYVTDTQPTNHVWTERSSYIPLHPTTSCLILINNAAGSSATLYVQFLLDLG